MDFRNLNKTYPIKDINKWIYFNDKYPGKEFICQNHIRCDTCSIVIAYGGLQGCDRCKNLVEYVKIK